MKTRIILQKEANRKLRFLMNNIEIINKGMEIGAWLKGDFKIENDQLTANIEDIYIPKQKVTRTEVDISPTSMIETIREIGPEETKKIKGHWHMHPFGKGTPSWSGQDENKIKDFMDPEKKREIFIFLLSSNDTIKARIEMNITMKIKEEEMPLKISLDNLTVETIEETEGFEDLIKEINEKVEEQKYETKLTTFYDDNKKEYSYNLKKGEWQERLIIDKYKDFSIRTKKNKIYLTINRDLATDILFSELAGEDLAKPDEVIDKTSKHVVWIYHLLNKEFTKQVAKQLEEEINSIAEELKQTEEDKETELIDKYTDKEYLYEKYNSRNWF